MPQLRSLPAQPTMRDLYKAYPATCKPLGELTEAAMRGPSPFTQGQRELIAAYVSGLNACAYCHTTHVAVAAACGVAPELFKALLADVETAPVEAKMKPILAYARKLTLSPARITAADAAAVYDAGWGDDALYATALVAALFNFYNRLVEGVGLALPDGYAAEAGKRLSTSGYDVFAQIARA
ncbi:carboxymuconolactone decarboxylase family protein [Methylocapsa sp. S129]|uniref:carboxymuconolactone decarboxylase family protein n=1 Tax=Methylocapsa sp. S129 TaxID=1641869 RepID=UPI00131DC082|nr:carboxymuconolactone decarboxylase family protein [Methylocapsa sp. S129]